MTYLWGLAAISVLGLHSANADDYVNCSISEETQVHFSNLESMDILTVSVSGAPCYEATLAITISSENGARWYHYEAPFKKHVVTHWEDPLLDEAATQLVQRLTDHNSFGLTSELPIWLPDDEYYEDNYQTIRVEKTYYEELQNVEWITYSHPIHYEGWKVIAFDQSKQVLVEVSEGGL
jgi:hypothetical protein